MKLKNKIKESVNKITDKIPKKDHISGVHCDVTNCVYHDPKSKCSANQIKVGPTYASQSGDTVCDTFKTK